MGFELKTLVVLGTDCIGSYKSNYHTITATTALAMMDNLLMAIAPHDPLWSLVVKTVLPFLLQSNH